MADGDTSVTYDHVWWWLPGGPWDRPDYKGRRCRVLARGKRNSILVELDDGHRVVTSRWAVRRAK